MNMIHFNTMNTMNTINMMHVINHHHTTETVSNITLTGWDVVIVVVGVILLILCGIKVTEWLFEHTFKMKDPWGCIISIVGIFSYVIVGLVVIGFFVSL